jgi:hypothetical protein
MARPRRGDLRQRDARGLSAFQNISTDESGHDSGERPVSAQIRKRSKLHAVIHPMRGRTRNLSSIRPQPGEYS